MLKQKELMLMQLQINSYKKHSKHLIYSLKFSKTNTTNTFANLRLMTTIEYDIAIFLIIL